MATLGVEQARRELLQASPTDPDAVLRGGARALQAGLYREAIPVVEAAVDANRGNARLWQLLGLLHRSLDRLAPAVDALTKAADLAPGDAFVAHCVAATALEAGLPAADLFERALRHAPGDETLLLGLAAALSGEGRADDAIRLLDERLARTPGWLKGHVALAQYRWMRGEGENCTRSLGEALASRPRDLPIWNVYVELILQSQSFERAITVIGEGRAAAGDHPAFDLAEAFARGERGETGAADELFRKLMPSKDIAVIERYVRHQLRARRPERALEAAWPIPPESQSRLWPYVSAAWRLTGDPRWEWLEGDERFIGVYDIASSLPSLEALAKRLRSLHLTSHHPLDQSLRGGTQTQRSLFSRIEPEIQALREAIVEAVERHIARLPPPQPGHPLLLAHRAPVRFSGSWSARLLGQGFHVNHVHPSGWLSSAFYVALPDAETDGPEHAGWLSLGEVGDLDLDLPPIRLVEPKPGRLVLFPSTMWHGTRPFTQGERLSVAFDVAPPVSPPA